MRRVFISPLCLLAGHIIPMSVAHAYDKAECNPALILDAIEYRDDYAAQLAVAEMVTESNFDQMKKTGALDVVYKGAPIKGSYEDFEEKRRDYRKQFNLQFNEEQSRGYLSRYLSDNSTEGYLACLRSKSKGVHVWATDASRDHLKVTISWNPGPDGKAAKLEKSTPIGGEFLDEVPAEWKPEYTRGYTVKRECGKEFRYVANMGGTEDSVLVPAYIALEPVEETKTLQTETVRKHSKAGDGGAKRSDPACIEADVSAGWEIDLNSIRKVYTENPFDRRGVGVHDNTDIEILSRNPSQVCVRAVAYPQSKEAIAGVAGYVTVTARRTIYVDSAKCGG